MKKSSLFLLFIICFTFTGYAQLDSVFYQGPATGSVASGVMVSLNQFTFDAPSEGENRIADRNTEVTYNESVIIDVDPSTLPEFVYVEDTNVHGHNDGTNGETVILNRWPGMNMENSIPPDPIVAAGPDHVIACVNSRFSVWDKQGNLLANINADTWIAPVINAGAFDPQIIYDHYAGRWFMLWDWQDDASQQGWFIISYTDNSDPFGTWYMYRLDARQNGTATTSTWGDFPQIGFDEEAIYINSRQFGFAGGLQYNKIRILNKSELYSSNGGLLTWKDIWDIRRPNQTSEKPDVLEPAISYTPGQGGYFFWTWSSPVPGGGSNVYYLYKILSPISTTPRLRGKVISTQFYYNSPDANQLGGGTALDAGSSKLRHSPIVRDGYLYMAHPVGNTTNTSYSAIRYAKVDLSVPSVAEHSEFGLIGYYYLYPALTVDKNHNIAVTFSRSGDSEYCGAFISTKHASDPAGLNPSVPIQVGLGNYVVTFGGSRNRWGDYMGIYLDPVNELNVWTFTEYARTGNTWGTYVGQIRMESYPGAHAFANSFTVDFGNLEVGSAPITKSVTVSNYGEDDLVINTINSPTGPFTLLTNLTLPYTLAPYDSVDLEFEFDPTDPVVYDEIMSFTNNDPDFSGFRMKGRGFEINETMTNVFYAVSNAVTPDTGRTLSLDKTSGNGTLLGKSNFADLRGLSIDPITNIMYGLVPSGSSTDLVRVNATEGDAYTLYTLPGLFMVGLDFDTSGVLYGALQSGGIYTIDLSNGSTTQVTTTVQLTSIAFDPTTNELWATPRVVVGQKDRIFKIDLSTGDTTIIGRTGFNVQTNDLAFDETGALYGVIGAAADIGKLISIDKTTAVGTEVGETGYTNVQSLAYRNSGTSSIGEGNELPVTFSLGQNYPNPFNPTTRIEFTLPVASDVELVVYNLLGQEMVTLLSEQKPAGYHSVIWNANDSKGIKLSSGIYFYKLKVSGVEGSEFQDIKKMILLK